MRVRIWGAADGSMSDCHAPTCGQTCRCRGVAVDQQPERARNRAQEMVAPGGFVDKYLLGRELTAEQKSQVKAGVEPPE